MDKEQGCPLYGHMGDPQLISGEPRHSSVHVSSPSETKRQGEGNRGQRDGKEEQDGKVATN